MVYAAIATIDGDSAGDSVAGDIVFGDSVLGDSVLGDSVFGDIGGGVGTQFVCPGRAGAVLASMAQNL